MSWLLKNLGWYGVREALRNDIGPRLTELELGIFCPSNGHQYRRFWWELNPGRVGVLVRFQFIRWPLVVPELCSWDPAAVDVMPVAAVYRDHALPEVWNDKGPVQ